MNKENNVMVTETKRTCLIGWIGTNAVMMMHQHTPDTPPPSN